MKKDEAPSRKGALRGGNPDNKKSLFSIIFILLFFLETVPILVGHLKKIVIYSSDANKQR